MYSFEKKKKKKDKEGKKGREDALSTSRPGSPWPRLQLTGLSPSHDAQRHRHSFVPRGPQIQPSLAKEAGWFSTKEASFVPRLGIFQGHFDYAFGLTRTLCFEPNPSPKAGPRPASESACQPPSSMVMDQRGCSWPCLCLPVRGRPPAGPGEPFLGSEVLWA